MAAPDPIADRFLALHVPGDPLLLPNPWDVGSARLMEHLGFRALATTSSGFAATLGRLDGSVTAEEALAHAASIAAATGLPVSADLEQGFADAPDAVAATVAAAAATGLAGCSVEDWSGAETYEPALARDRVVAAAEAAHGGPRPIVLTARADGHLHGDDDLDATIRRLRSFDEAGADVVYAPGLTDLHDIARVVDSVGCPVNVLALPGGPAVDELAEVGVARVSVGGLLNVAAIGAVAQVATRFRDDGVVESDLFAPGFAARDAAFADERP